MEICINQGTTSSEAVGVYYSIRGVVSAYAIDIFYLCFRPVLPDYLLDFGYVILGTVRTHIVRVTNPSLAPVSFSVDHNNLTEYGFNVELDKVRQLPGAPDHEPIDFVVSFDPRGANLPLGDVEAVVPINVSWCFFQPLSYVSL